MRRCWTISGGSRRWRKLDRTSIIALWLPPYHDMGLVFGLIIGAYFGIRQILMAPMSFLQRPLRWLEAMSRVPGNAHDRA